MSGTKYTVHRSKDGAVIGTETQIPPLGSRDVLIRITHSGVCNADAMYAMKGAPMALGHEGVGIVEAIGPQVTQFAPGDRAGGGFHRNSCGQCRYCLSGEDIYCPARVIYGAGDLDNGTFAQYYIGKETYVHRIPDSLASEHAAPLQCAGAAVYTALRATVKPSSRVGIIGIGGLGHLAIQFAANLGADVVALSSTPEKKKEALELGATDFGVLGDWDCKTPLETIVITSSKFPDWNNLINPKVLSSRGTIVPLTAGVATFNIPAGPMLSQGYRIHPNLVASRAEHDEMLDFASRRGIKPIVQVYKYKGPETIQHVFAELLANKVRYRAVLRF